MLTLFLDFYAEGVGPEMFEDFKFTLKFTLLLTLILVVEELRVKIKHDVIAYFNHVVIEFLLIPK